MAVQGDAAAQTYLGVMYQIGQGVPQNHAEAVRWYRKAAKQGNASAQFDLGVMYTKGHGVTQGYVQAHMWFSLAGAQGHKQAVKNRDIAAERMTPGQIAEAQRRAAKWRPRR